MGSRTSCLNTSCGSVTSSTPRQSAIRQGQRRNQSTHTTARLLIQKLLNAQFWKWLRVCMVLSRRGYLQFHLKTICIYLGFAGPFGGMHPKPGQYPACQVSNPDMSITNQPQAILSPKKPEKKSSSYKLLWFSSSDGFLSHVKHHPHIKHLVYKKTLFTLYCWSDE